MFNNGNTAFSMPVVPAGYGSGGYGMGGFGGDWWGIIVLLLIFGAFNGNGFGFGGFGGNGGYSEIQRGFDQNAVINKLDGLTYGLSDSTYALNNSIMQGFHGVDNAICTLGYQNQQGFNTLAHQISDCCCATQRAIDGVNYNIATQTCDIKHAITDSTRQVLDFLTTDKIAALQAENQSLKTQIGISNQNAYITANQEAQTATLLRRLGAECPQAAYIVNAPTPVTFPVNSCGQFAGFNNYGYGNGCGCA